MLKDIAFQPGLKDTLEVWDEQLAHYGAFLIESRKAFVEELNDIMEGIHRSITGDREQIKLVYEPSVQSSVFLEELTNARERDIRFKMTSLGPHRDDLCVKVNEIDIRKYGSQGQQRTAALSLKLSEIYMVKKIIKDMPVLLLDDVLSELDSNRQNYLLNSIRQVQTMITCTGLDDFIDRQFHMNKVFKVVEGKVKTGGNV